MLNVSIDSMTMCVGIIPNPHELSFRTNRNRAPMHEITSKYCQRNLTFTSSFILRPSSFHSTSRSRYRYIIYSKSVYPIKKSTMSAFGSPQQQQSSIAPEDCNIPQPGGDGISSLCWSPTANSHEYVPNKSMLHACMQACNKTFLILLLRTVFYVYSKS